MRKPVYIPSIETFNQREYERQQMATFREQMLLLMAGASVALAGMICLLLA